MALGFANEKAREQKARVLVEKREDHGREVLTFDPVKWRRFMEFEKIVGEEVDPVIVAHEWMKSKQGKPQASGKLVRDAVTDYFTLRDEERSWGDDAKRHAFRQLERFASVFGAKRLFEIGVDDVREWLRGLTDNDGGPLSPHSIKDHRKNVNTFFDYCVRERWGALENPCAFIKPPKIEDGDPVVIPLQDAWNFFRANRDERVIGRLALEAFAGVRYTTAGLIAKEGLNFDGRGIRMSARIHKSGKKDGRTRYRQGHPENLWAWLAHAPESMWGMRALDYREEKRHASIRANLRPAANQSDDDEKRILSLRNIWRHSFISYHLAAFRNVPATQYLAQHSNSKTTEEYEGIADHMDALRYFMITPETVKLPWEKFLKLPVTKPPAK